MARSNDLDIRSSADRITALFNARRISLIEARKLLGLWTSHYAQLDDIARARLPFKPVLFLAGDE
jgi:hypothetical protein